MGREEPAHPGEIPSHDGADDPERLELLIAEVRHYIDHVYVDMADSHHRRTANPLDHRQSHSFFVSRERFERLREILEYLLQFIRRLPLAPDADALLQFRQFRDHLLAHFALLQEADVTAAAQLAHSPGSELLPETARLAERTARELIALVRSARAPRNEEWAKLFRALRRYANFWFEIKGARYDHIRESDVYLFRLADFLLHRVDATAADERPGK